MPKMPDTSPKLENNMLLIGVGKAGGKAAYYVLQRGGLPGLRICVMDSDAEALGHIQGLNTILLPENEEQNAEEKYKNLHEALEAQFPALQLLLVVCGLGGRTGCHYSLEILRHARRHNLACAAIVAMPHSFDALEMHSRASGALKELREITPAVQLLPCQEFGKLFVDKSQQEAYPQAARWLAETSLGFLHPFVDNSAPGRKEAKNKLDEANNQLTFTFQDQPLGIFAGGLPSKYYGENLDLPSCQRLKIHIDPGE
jgi:cell division GTPase FtsZ